MHARLAGVARGAETIAHYRRRGEEGMNVPKPQFGNVAKVTGEDWEGEGPEAAHALRARIQEIRQQRFAAGEGEDWGEAVPWVRCGGQSKVEAC